MFLYSTKSSQLSFMERYHKETLAKARARTFPYHRYTQEEINAYNTVNLVHLCIYISENAVSYQTGKLVVRSAPYVIIYPEGFYDTKSRKCYTPVNGLKAFFGFDFLQALYIIKSYFESEALFHMDDYVNEHYPLVCDSYLAADYNLNYVLKYNLLDRKDNNSLKMVYSVLHNRMHIERDVITKFLRSKKLIVYGGFDLCFLEYLDDNVIAVTKKLQNKDHMATEVMTVKRNTTFTWDNDSSLYYHNVYIFEDVYQIMSYLSLIELGLVPPLVKNNIMLSLNGMSFDALKAFLKEHSEVKAIYACLSNTRLSIDTIKDIPFDSKKVVNMQTYLKEYTAENGLVETWNDMLKEEAKKKS